MMWRRDYTRQRMESEKSGGNYRIIQVIGLNQGGDKGGRGEMMRF